MFILIYIKLAVLRYRFYSSNEYTGTCIGDALYSVTRIY